ncbi:retrovirus-related pol polyprotein [Lentinula edodes]|uniref:Retrovirus-related pol polyprotein n=1 Tax=Lentinula edodes TaxID=5353 RepID=A0A1Q3ES80_LENED|nr:retrovirus-related pol polyprotein [Lentinula edodes]
MMLCSDGASSIRVPYFISNKRAETTLKHFHEFRIMAENQTGERLRMIRIDGGGELNNKLMQSYCKEHGIVVEKIPPYSSAANGMAERANRTVIEEAASTFIYVDNFVPTARSPDVVPMERWTKKRQDVSHLRPFGCEAWATLPETRKDGKLARQAIKGRLLGYMGHRGYRIWVPEWKTIIESRDVKFEEGIAKRTQSDDKISLGSNGDAEDIKSGAPLESDLAPSSSPSTPPSLSQLSPLTPIPSEPDSFPQSPIPDSIPTPKPPAPTSTRVLRERTGGSMNIDQLVWKEMGWNRPDTAFTLVAHEPWAFASTHDERWTPRNFKEAKLRWDLWGPPAQAEYDALMEKGVWELVPLPQGANLMDAMWIFTSKWGSQGELLKRKARYVAKGYTQVYGMDYDETFGAVARMESFRIVLAIIVVLGLSLFQVDFKSAFLNSPIKHNVYMKQPEGFVEPGTEHLVCKLKKSIYGTMQGSHDWQETLAAGYKEDGYTSSQADPCVRWRRQNGKYTITSTYGDDVLGGAEGDVEKKKALEDLGKRWESGEVRSEILLGMKITQDKKTGAITLSQKAYFTCMLEHFGLQNVKRRRTPLSPDNKLEAAPNPLPDDERTFMHDKPYRPVVGSMMWGQVCTRPDISFAANKLARYQLNPGRQHWEAIEWLAGYILETLDYTITYRKPPPGSELTKGEGLKPCGYLDADHAGCMDTRRSTSGNVFFMAGAPVTWSSKRQPTVALSTTEAEYISAARASQQASWLMSFLAEVDLRQDGPLTLHCDNFAAVSLTQNSKKNMLVKHIEMRYHFIREKVENGEIAMKLIRTGENVADIFTKALNGTIHSKWVKFLGLDRTD